MKRSIIGCAVICIVALAVLGSCSGYRGYGVLVWKNENLPFPVGEFLNISSIFSVDNYYEVDYQGEFVQVPIWQVEFFESHDEAKAFHESFLKYADKYAFTLKYGGLPIRSEPATTANIVFKLQPGKIAKVIGLSLIHI